MKVATSAPFEPRLKSLLAALSLAVIAACGTNPAPAPPPGLKLDNVERFGFDNTITVHVTVAKGHVGSLAVARLADADGRRAITFSDTRCQPQQSDVVPCGDIVESKSGCGSAKSIKIQCKPSEFVVAPPDWNLPPAAAASSKPCHNLICWSHLPGEDSELTVGPMPDPTGGVSLYCRFFDGKKLGDKVQLGQFTNPTTKAVEYFKAAWLRNVVSQNDGTFIVSYYVDDGWFGGPARQGNAHYRQVFNPETGTIDQPTITQPACNVPPA